MPHSFYWTNLIFLDPAKDTKPYSVYTSREKWFIVAVTGFAAVFR